MLSNEERGTEMNSTENFPDGIAIDEPAFYIPHIGRRRL